MNSSMSFEVEQKYRVADFSEVRRVLADLGAKAGETVTQVDVYFAHPGRDFGATDEALRIRRVGDVNCLTYKGPKIDATTKTRREVELEIAPGEQGATIGNQLLEALGFCPVAKVSKVRCVYHFQRDSSMIELALDKVERVGTFVELEIMADGEADIEPARQAIAAMAAELKLTEVERRGYLELLLASQEVEPSRGPRRQLDRDN